MTKKRSNHIYVLVSTRYLENVDNELRQYRKFLGEVIKWHSGNRERRKFPLRMMNSLMLKDVET